MSRYLDRLTSDARVQFEAACRARSSRDIPEYEDMLIELARDLPMWSPSTAATVLQNRFGQAEARAAADLLEEIRADLGRDAQVAGENVEEEATSNFTFVFAQIEGASPEEVETFAKMIGGIVANRG